MTIRTVFDGERIVLPKELEGHDPCVVEIVFADKPGDKQDQRSSLWDIVARSKGTLPANVILQENSDDRNGWGS